MTSPDPSHYTRGPARNRALRLMFEYDRRDVRLVSVQRLEMIAPPPQALAARPGERGSWFELQDAEGHPLYRRVIDNPVRRDLEVVAEDREESLQRVQMDEPRGAFFLVAPDLPLARSVVLRTEPAPQRDAERTRPADASAPEVTRFELSAPDQETR